MTDWGSLYADHIEAVAALADGLDDATLARAVPASPAWSVHDVYAHLAGGPADQVAGRTEGAPGPEWTARHVGERAGVSVADLVAELRSHAEAMAAGFTSDAAAGPVWDIATHHADLHEALGLHVLPERLWMPVLQGLGPSRLAALPITVPVGTETWGAGGPVVEVSPYELFRAVFSRRSRAQLEAWTADLPAEAVDGIGVFGPRDDDQPVPA